MDDLEYRIDNAINLEAAEGDGVLNSVEAKKDAVLAQLRAGRRHGVYKTLELENARGHLYFVRDMTWGEWAQYKLGFFDDPAAPKEQTSPHEEQPIDSQAPGRDQMDQRIQNLHYHPSQYLGANVSVLGVDVVDVGEVSTDVDGKEIDLDDDTSVTIDKDHHIVAVTYKYVTIARDSRFIGKIDSHHVKISVAVDAAKAIVTGLGAGLHAFIHSQFADGVVNATKLSPDTPQGREALGENPTPKASDE